mmetsp:Transcript_10167/g.24229  ORF Transcript_10167/g.24229 Transcript_10167/m.24229 type:complete len:351 (+) Transcript_10167:1736-2788(+)
MHVPRSNLAVVGCLDGHGSSSKITSRKKPGSIWAAVLVRNHSEARIIKSQRREMRAHLRRHFTAKSGDDGGARQCSLGPGSLVLAHHLMVAVLVLLILEDELQTLDLAAGVHVDLAGAEVGQEIGTLPNRQLALFEHGAHVSEGLAKHAGHPLGPATEGRSDAIESSVSCTEHHDVPTERRQLLGLRGASSLGGLGHGGEELFGSPHAVLWAETLKAPSLLGLVHPKPQEYCCMRLLEPSDGQVLTQLAVVLELHTKVFAQPDLPPHSVIVAAELGNLVRRQTPGALRLLVYSHVVVPQAPQVVGTADSRWPGTDDSHRGIVGWASPRVGVPHLLDPHLHEFRACELLQT